jgi:hypothetical protein
MHEDLWAGVDLKAKYAEFFLEEMSRSLQPPKGSAALESAGVTIETPWERSFYPRLDAFLAMARSISEIIHSCFGADTGSRPMRIWFYNLPSAEQTRRQSFSDQFEPHYRVFRQHALSNARNISFHRTGYSAVEVSITGRFGVNHIGSPVKQVPAAESRDVGDPGNDPALLWATTQTPLPVRPMWSDFTIDGKPLFAECQAYLAQARQLADQARGIAQHVHGTDSLTSPPSS